MRCFPRREGAISRDFLKNTVLTVGIAYLLFTWGKILFINDGQGEYFYVALFCGVPFGIRRIFVWLVPFGHDISFTIGIFDVSIIAGGIIGVFVLTWKLLVAAWYTPLTAVLPFPGPIGAFFGSETVSSVIYALFNGVYEELYFLSICLAARKGI